MRLKTKQLKANNFSIFMSISSDLVQSDLRHNDSFLFSLYRQNEENSHSSLKSRLFSLRRQMRRALGPVLNNLSFFFTVSLIAYCFRCNENDNYCSMTLFVHSCKTAGSTL